jgi:hypothetical protein
MKTVAGFFIVVSIVIGISSCQKEIDWGLNNSTHNDSIYIKSYILLDTSFASGTDTSEKALFAYDSQKRITRIDGYEYTPGTTGITAIAWDQRFYNGNDTLPYKIIWKESGTLEIDTAFIWYSNGSVNRDSVVYNNGFSDIRKTQIFNQLSSSRIFQRRTIIDASNAILEEDSSFFIRNFISPASMQASDTVYNNLLPPASLFFVQTFDIQFDNNPNPFRKLNFNYPPDFGEYVGQPGIFWGGELSLLKNNFLAYTRSYLFPGPISTYTINYSYTYRNDGYPIVSRYNNGAPAKAIYIYTKL